MATGLAGLSAATFFFAAICLPVAATGAGVAAGVGSGATATAAITLSGGAVAGVDAFAAACIVAGPDLAVSAPAAITGARKPVNEAIPAKESKVTDMPAIHSMGCNG